LIVVVTPRVIELPITLVSATVWRARRFCEAHTRHRVRRLARLRDEDGERLRVDHRRS